MSCPKTIIDYFAFNLFTAQKLRLRLYKLPLCIGEGSILAGRPIVDDNFPQLHDAGWNFNRCKLDFRYSNWRR